MASELSICVDIDDDEADVYGRLILKAVEHAREIAVSDPERASNGFKLFVCDERNELVFEVDFGPRQHRTLH